MIKKSTTQHIVLQTKPSVEQHLHQATVGVWSFRVGPASTFSKKTIFKIESHGSIHIFKNYFVTVFSVFNNKQYRNRQALIRKIDQFNSMCIVFLLSQIETKIFSHPLFLSIYKDLRFSICPPPLSLSLSGQTQEGPKELGPSALKKKKNVYFGFFFFWLGPPQLSTTPPTIHARHRPPPLTHASLTPPVAVGGLIRPPHF